jgi:hypothetical protein
MERRFSLLAGLVAGVLVGAAFVAPAAAGDTPLRPEEAKRFVANKLFNYTCFDGTKGAGRISADGSVIGTMQATNGPLRFVSLPSGTIKLTSDSICAALPRALIQPCFNVVQTSPQSFRGSVRGLSFAYCDFVRRNPRLELAEGQARPHEAPSEIALRPSRY